MNYDEYERLKDTLDILSDPVSMRQIAQSKGFYPKGRPGESFEAASDLSLRAQTPEAIMASIGPIIPTHGAPL